MTIDKLYFENGSWLIEKEPECVREAVDIVFVFSDIEVIKAFEHSSLLKQIYPNAQIVGTSTAGNILDDALSEHAAVATAVSFKDAYVLVKTLFLSKDALFDDGKNIIESLEKENLKHIFVLMRGLGVNSAEIVRGMNENASVPITGGLAGDGDAYKESYVFANELAGENLLIAVGFYGASLHFEVGCKAGWEEFGAKRTITASKDNVIYEIDNKPAIELYEKYLGEYIKDLPGSALLFPLSIKMDEENENEVIRVVLHINEDGSMVFAGDVPQGASACLMKTNINNLIDGSELVANSIKQHNSKRALTLVVSCTGRLNVLKQLVDEEIEVVQTILGENTQIVGFYSYGEIAPFSNDLLSCQLHNQTMTLTSIYED